MKTITKKFSLAGLCAIFALTISLGVGLITGNSKPVQADDSNGPNTATFFYDNLLDEKNQEYTLAKKFYNVLAKMDETGDFKDGVVDYRLDEVVTSEQLKAWIEEGNLEVPKAFGAARDAFLTDIPRFSISTSIR